MIAIESKDMEFLGHEFLTWLWFRTEEHGGIFDLPGLGPVGLAFDKLLEFKEEEFSTHVTVRSDAVTRAPESQVAIQTGKQLHKARIVIGLGDENFEFTLEATNLDIQSLAIPKSTGETPMERIQEDIDRLNLVAQIVHELFNLFLHDRLSPSFEAETASRIRGWITDRSSHLTPSIS